MSSEQSRQALRPAVGGMVTFSLADEINRIKSSTEWASVDRHATSLVKDAPLNLLLMVLKKGARLHEHRTKGPVAVQVVAGSIRFSAAMERVLAAGEMVGLDRNVAHSVEALEESAMLLITAID
jgi:quercetin dioxygenase-like cupin family protein